MAGMVKVSIGDAPLVSAGLLTICIADVCSTGAVAPAALEGVEAR